MKKYVDAELLKVELRRQKCRLELSIQSQGDYGQSCHTVAYDNILSLIDSLQEEQPDEQPEYGYLSTKYIHGKKPRWNVGDVLAYYICTSNEEGECLLGKIVNVQFDEDWWVYTFEDKSTWDEQSLVEEGAYKKN